MHLAYKPTMLGL